MTPVVSCYGHVRAGAMSAMMIFGGGKWSGGQDLCLTFGRVMVRLIHTVSPLVTRLRRSAEASIWRAWLFRYYAGQNDEKYACRPGRNPPVVLERFDCFSWGTGGPAVSASDCGVRGPRFESHRRRLCLSRQPLRYAALGTGCGCACLL